MGRDAVSESTPTERQSPDSSCRRAESGSQLDSRRGATETEVDPAAPEGKGNAESPSETVQTETEAAATVPPPVEGDDSDGQTPSRKTKRRKSRKPTESGLTNRIQVLRVHSHLIPHVGQTLTTSLTCEIGVNGVKSPVLIDSGATHSLMSAELFDKLGGRAEHQLNSVRVDLDGAFTSGEEEANRTESKPKRVRTDGMWMEVPLKMGEHEYAADFHVCRNSSLPLILGMDFLISHEAVLKCSPPASLTLTSRGRVSSTMEPVTTVKGTIRRCAVVQDTGSHTPIAARARQFVAVNVPCAQEGPMLFEPMIQQRAELVVPAQLIDVDADGKAKVCVENRGSVQQLVDSRLLGAASLLAKGDSASRHPGSVAVFQPTARVQGCAKGMGKARKCHHGAGAYAFMHHEDVKRLRAYVGDDHSVEQNATAPLLATDAHTKPVDAASEKSNSGSRRRRRRGKRVPRCALGPGSVRAGGGVNTIGGVSTPRSRNLASARCAGKRDHSRGEDTVRTANSGVEFPSHLASMLPEKDCITPKQMDELKTLVLEYGDIFVAPGGEVGFTDRATHTINVGSAQPIKQAPRKTSFAEKTLIEDTVRELLSAGKIRPSRSAWASPVVLVKKKDGTMRFCIDYRRLNDATVKDAYPLPRIDDALDYLNGASYFSALDLASAYWQVAMDPESIDKTAFCTHVGLYEWLVMPFGLSNAPATCERLMEEIFRGMQWNGALVYLDDLVAYGKTWTQALNRLRAMFQKLREANLTLKPSKCMLMTREITYLGHSVSESGVRPGAHKVKAIEAWPAPKTLDEVRSFLGLCGYYRRFVDNYADVTKPLTGMLKKGAEYVWGKEQQRSFRTLKQALTSYPCLGMIRPEGRLIVDTDASDYAIGAVLSQVQDGEERVLAYHSKTLNDAQTRYCTTKKELLAMKEALEVWDHYLQNPSESFLLRTDHAALKWLTTMAIKDRTLSRWAQYLAEYNFECEHRPGREHINADSLSRVVYRPCEFAGCTDCGNRKPNSDFLFKSDEEVKRGHGELTVTRKNGKTILSCAVTRSQRRKQRLLASEKPQVDNLDSESKRQPPAGRGAQKSTPVGANQRERVQPHRKCRVKPPVCNPLSPREVTPGDSGARTEGRRPPRTRRGKRRAVKQRARKRRTRQGSTSLTDKTMMGGEEVAYAPTSVDTSSDTGEAITPTGAGIEFAADQPANTCTDSDNRNETAGGRSTEVGAAAAPTEIVPTELGKGELTSTEIGVANPNEVRGKQTQELGVMETWEKTLVDKESRHEGKDWVGLQDADPDLARFKKLLTVFGDEPPVREQLARESETVIALAKSWPLFRIREGLLEYVNIEPGPKSRTSRFWSKDWRIVVPQAERLELVRHLHKGSAHLSARRIEPELRKRFWWRTMGSDIRVWTRCCDICQRTKPGTGRGRYPLSQAGYSGPLDRVGIDISGPWPRSEGGSKYILAITDYFTKWLELVPLPDKSARSVARALHRFACRYGVMRRLHSDRGTEFTAAVSRHLCELLGATQTFTSGGAPWSNAQVERGNRTIRSMLCALVEEHGLEWDECLCYAMQAYNGTEHASTGYTPYLLMHSMCRDPRLPVDLLLTASNDDQRTRDLSCLPLYVEEQRTRAQKVFALVRSSLNHAAQMQATQHEKAGMRPYTYESGQECWYYYPPNVKDKLGTPWIGPFRILATDPSKNLVRLALKDRDKWVNGANTKPVSRLSDGGFL